MNLIALSKKMKPDLTRPGDTAGKLSGAAVDGKRIWNFFKSVQLAVTLMLMLASTAVIGTLLPQNQAMVVYRETYGEITFTLFSALDLFDMYHAVWFRVLLLLFIANIVVCSVDRFKVQKKIIFNKSPRFYPARFKNAGFQAEIESKTEIDSLVGSCRELLTRDFRFVKTEKKGDTAFVFAERGRWTRLGVYIVHASIILLALGAVIGSLFGFEGHVSIPEGGTADHFSLQPTGETIPLPFSIKCEAFNISFYDSKIPSEYRSTVTVLKNDRQVTKKDILVNHPLRLNGISIFQSGYGNLPPDKMLVSFQMNDSGHTFEKEVTRHQPVPLPKNLGTVTLTDFVNSHAPAGKNLGESAVFLLEKEGQRPQKIIIPFRYPKFDQMRGGEFSAAITDYHLPYYTNLRISKDPGVGVVYAGFLMMIAGFWITFLMSHQRVMVALIEKDGRIRITVSGMANRNDTAVDRIVQKIGLKLTQGDRPC